MPDDNHPDSDALLAAIQRQETTRKHGKLKAFSSMSARVGKTYVMLDVAQKDEKAESDFVAGYIETYGRRKTRWLAEGLPLVPRKQVEHRGVALMEMDLEAVESGTIHHRAGCGLSHDLFPRQLAALNPE